MSIQIIKGKYIDIVFLYMLNKNKEVEPKMIKNYGQFMCREACLIRIPPVQNPQYFDTEHLLHHSEF